jgi:hypothetical protein
MTLMIYYVSDDGDGRDCVASDVHVMSNAGVPSSFCVWSKAMWNGYGFVVHDWRPFCVFCDVVKWYEICFGWTICCAWTMCA